MHSGTLLTRYLFISIALVFSGTLPAQPFTRQDSLRGSITPEREWWDLSYYDLAIDFDIKSKRIRGTNSIRFQVLKPGQVLQLDLQEPLQVTKIMHGKTPLTYTREGNVYWVRFPQPLPPGVVGIIDVSY
jgi:hypothetical protein